MPQRILLCLIALSLAPAVAIAQDPTIEPIERPSAVKVYGHWATGCASNTRRTWKCTGIALITSDDPAPHQIVMRLERYIHSLASISFPKVLHPAEDFVIKVDGRTVYRGDGARGANHYRRKFPISIHGWSDDPTKLFKLLDAIARGNQLKLISSSGDTLGIVSLKGSAAAMRHMDRAQELAGSETAFFKRGKKSGPQNTTTSVPYPESLRGIQLPTLNGIQKLLTSDACGIGMTLGKLHKAAPFTADGSITLILADCGNVDGIPVTQPYFGYRRDKDKADRHGWAVAPAEYISENGESASLPLLFNAEAKIVDNTVTLTASHFGSDKKDCGIRTTFRFSGGQYRTGDGYRTLFSKPARYEMPVCGGDTQWIRVE